MDRRLEEEIGIAGIRGEKEEEEDKIKKKNKMAEG